VVCSMVEKFSNVFSIKACALIWPIHTVEGDVDSIWNSGESCHLLYPWDFFPWPQWNGKIVYMRQRRQETSVSADIEWEISSTNTPVTSLCGLILGVVKEGVCYSTFRYFLWCWIRIRMKNFMT